MVGFGAALRVFHRIVIVVLLAFILFPARALAQEVRPGKHVPPRTLRDGEPPEPDVSSLRLRVETPDGVLVVWDANAPNDVGDVGCSGYLVYWQPAAEDATLVYGRVVRGRTIFRMSWIPCGAIGAWT